MAELQFCRYCDCEITWEGLNRPKNPDGSVHECKAYKVWEAAQRHEEEIRREQNAEIKRKYREQEGYL